LIYAEKIGTENGFIILTSIFNFDRDEKQKRERTKNTGIATEMQQSKLSRTKRLRTADFIINAAKST
jgi:hypothetical protein